MTCTMCEAGNKPVRMKRQIIHYIKWRIVLCENQAWQQPQNANDKSAQLERTRSSIGRADDF